MEVVGELEGFDIGKSNSPDTTKLRHFALTSQCTPDICFDTFYPSCVITTPTDIITYETFQGLVLVQN